MRASGEREVSRVQRQRRPPLTASPPIVPNVGGAGSLSVSTATLRATVWASARSVSRALLTAEAPPRRSKAKAARLKMASATSISIRVKPFAGSRPEQADRRRRPRSAADLDRAVMAYLDRDLPLLAPQGQPEGDGQPGGVKASAALATFADLGAGAARPRVAPDLAPVPVLAPRDRIAAGFDRDRGRPRFDDRIVARRPG